MEQINERANFIWSTESAAALGLSKYKTPLQLYLEKIGEIEPEPVTNESAAIGLHFQDAIAKAHTFKTGDRLKSLEGVEHVAVYHGLNLGAHYDFFNESTNRLHEVKFFNARRLDEFGNEGTDSISLDIYCQVMHQMIVWNESNPRKCIGAEVNVLFGNESRRVYIVNYNDDAAAEHCKALAKFWACVELKLPPEPVNNDDVKKLYAQANDDAIIADDYLLDLYNRIFYLKTEEKKLSKDIDSLEFQIKKAMGASSAVKLPTGEPLFTWKNNKDSTVFDSETFKRTMPDTYSKFMKSRKGNRVFLVK